MELDELEVGDPRPGAQGHGHPVTGRDGRVGRRCVDLPEPAAGQDDGPGMSGADPVDLALTEDVQGHTADPSVGVIQEVDDHRVLDHLDAGVVLHCMEGLDEGPLDFLAGRIAAGVGDAVTVVTTLAGQLDRPLGVTVEVGAERDQLAHAFGALGDEDAHGLGVTQADPGDQGVLEVLLRRVLRVEGSGDAALGPRRRALVQDRLGHEEHPVDLLPQLESTGEPGDPGADDDHIGGGRPAGLWSGEPTWDAQRIGGWFLRCRAGHDDSSVERSGSGHVPARSAGCPPTVPTGSLGGSLGRTPPQFIIEQVA